MSIYYSKTLYHRQMNVEPKMSETKCSESDLNVLLCPIEAIDCTLAFASKDWSIDKNDAWIYGIVAGWDDDSLAELKAQFRWTTETVEQLKALHAACNKLRA